MQHRHWLHALRHALADQRGIGNRKAKGGGRRRSVHATRVGGVLEGKVSAVRIYPIAYGDAGGVNEAILELIDIEDHVDGVELYVHMELIQDRDRHVLLGTRLDIQRRTEGTQVSRGHSDIAGAADLFALDAEFFIVLTVELVSEDADVRKDGESTIRDHANR